ncbi:SWIM zinc finger family protein [Labedaea rhizosphaerae]|uniref:SWIM zinc finger protein n=1 Tax=Labedaea rhizosphaerae TaxID=598644 RepID=A0A4R6RQZ0_LABRH|nr:SWIM zinc finger family protein [Labedaea rhizosphaerae]TDP89223.1 SWIM zinc finger protein [Labedaea rhizosphaerae]
MRWTADQVLALAPDAASVSAGRKQAEARWTDEGGSDAAVWGYCQGSGSRPYQVAVDPSGPAYKCTCPSRKFPCKHALGLLLRWSAGRVPDADAPGWVEAWLQERAARSIERADKAERTEVRDPAAAERRAAQREQRVSAGVAELTGWLSDQLARGLAGLDRDGGLELFTVAARMVDAQAPGLASGLRRAASLIGRSTDWPDRVLDEFAQLYLLARAHAGLADLPGPLAETVRSRLGYTVEKERVRADGERVADTWLVTGAVDDINERLTSRRVWLRGLGTGRRALVLSFAPPGRPLDSSLVPGTQVAAELAFHPGALSLRALVIEQGEPVVAKHPSGETVGDALTSWSAALAVDPWLERWPVLLRDVVPAAGDSDSWLLRDEAGDALPLRRTAEPWRLLAVSAGRPVTVSAEWSTAGLRPMSCWDGNRPVPV